MSAAAPARSHLAPFREGAGPYLTLLRNAIPVAGVWALGWSAAQTALLLWFDGVAALAALCVMVMLARMRLGLEAADKASSWAGLLFVLAFFGVPYWMTLLAFNAYYFPAGFWSAQLADPALVGALLAVLAGSVMEEARRGLVGMSEENVRRISQGQFAIHWGRGVVVLFLLALVPVKVQYFVVVAAAALSYAEIYPRRTLRLLGLEHEIHDAPGLRD